MPSYCPRLLSPDMPYLLLHALLHPHALSLQTLGIQLCIFAAELPFPAQPSDYGSCRHTADNRGTDGDTAYKRRGLFAADMQQQRGFCAVRILPSAAGPDILGTADHARVFPAHRALCGADTHLLNAVCAQNTADLLSEHLTLIHIVEPSFLHDLLSAVRLSRDGSDYAVFPQKQGVRDYGNDI